MKDEREDDIQALCSQVLNMSASQNYNPNGADWTTCPMCYATCDFMGQMDDIKHNANCGYLIAKDLSAKQK